MSGRRFNCILNYILRGSILSSWRRSRDPRVLHEATEKGAWRPLAISLSFSPDLECWYLLPGDWTHYQWWSALAAALSMWTLVGLQSFYSSSQSHFWRIQSSSQTKLVTCFHEKPKNKHPLDDSLILTDCLF